MSYKQSSIPNTYRGKYPNRVAAIWSEKGRGYFVKTNDGKIMKLAQREFPKLGSDSQLLDIDMTWPGAK